MGKTITPECHGALLHRDSGGRHEMTPAAYVDWAIRQAKIHSVQFDGTSDVMDRMIQQRESVVGDIYLDYEVSGKNLSRPALDQLLERARKDKLLTHVFIPRADRLARPEDPIHGLNLEDQFRHAGVWLVFQSKVLEPFERGQRRDIGELINSVIEYDKAGEERKTLAQKMIHAQIQLARKGFSTGGRAPFGFDRWLISSTGEAVRRLEDGEIVRQEGHHVVWLPGDEDKVAICLRIRSMLQDLPASRVAKILNHEQVPSPDSGRLRRDNGVSHHVSGRWNVSTINNIGRNPLFAAETSYGKRSIGDQLRFSPDGPRTLADQDYVDGSDRPKVVENAKENRITAEASFEPLICLGEHERLQKTLDQRAGTQRRKPRSRDPKNNLLGDGSSILPVAGQCIGSREGRVIVTHAGSTSSHTLLTVVTTVWSGPKRQNSCLSV